MADRPPGPELKPTPPSDIETRRFATINLLRLSGVAFVIFGLLIVNGCFDVAPAAGYVLLVVGLLDVFLVPQVLARKWRSPGE